MPSNGGVLSDIKVLDLSQGVSGPFCAKFLAGLGAEVIKVEPSVKGDSSRHSEPFLGMRDDVENSALFAYLNTSKMSVTLDLEIPEQALSVKQLAQETDILVESYAPGYLESLGLGYDALSNNNPGLIYVSVTPFGQTGPYRDYKGADLIAQAIGALMYTIGLPDREPLKVGGESVLYTIGISAFSAAMLVLHVRDAQGFGQHVDISAMEVMTVAQIHSSINDQFGHQPQSFGNRSVASNQTGLFGSARDHNFRHNGRTRTGAGKGNTRTMTASDKIHQTGLVQLLI